MIENEQNNNVIKGKRWLLLLIIGVVLLSLFFGGKQGWKWHKNHLLELERKKDSLIELSIKRQDSLQKVISDAERISLIYQEQIKNLNNQNTLLYDKLKKKERELRTAVDTSFRNNARRIADSVNRFYSKQNDLR